MQVIIPKNARILIIIVTTVTNRSSTDLKKIDQPNSGHNGQETPRSP